MSGSERLSQAKTIPWIILFAVFIANFIVRVSPLSGSVETALSTMFVYLLLISLFISTGFLIFSYSDFIFGQLNKEIINIVENFINKLCLRIDNSEGFHTGLNAIKLILNFFILLLIYSLGALPFVLVVGSTFTGISPENLDFLSFVILTLIFCYRLAITRKLLWAGEVKSLMASLLYLGAVSLFLVAQSGKLSFNAQFWNNIAMIVALLDLIFIENKFLLSKKSEITSRNESTRKWAFPNKK